MVLEAGDVITTGTPPGVGSAKKPPEYLKAGDKLALKIRRPRRAARDCRAVQGLAECRDNKKSRPLVAGFLFASFTRLDAAAVLAVVVAREQTYS